jgi:hypothetical protein
MRGFEQNHSTLFSINQSKGETANVQVLTLNNAMTIRVLIIKHASDDGEKPMHKLRLDATACTTSHHC